MRRIRRTLILPSNRFGLGAWRLVIAAYACFESFTEDGTLVLLTS